MTRLIPTLAIVIAFTTWAHADSGLIRLSEVSGPWRVTVMTDPTPLRQGPVDVSVLVQDEATGRVIPDASIELSLQHDSGLLVLVEATTAQAEVQLMQAAKFPLPESGDWSVETIVASATNTATVQWSFTAAPPLPPFDRVWPWLLPVPLGIMLYAINRRIRAGATHA